MAQLNPLSLEGYVGQVRVKKNLQTIIAAVDGRHIFDDPVDHILLSGPPGCGKTNLAEIISHELKSPLLKLMGPQIRDVDDLEILRSIKPWTFVFIDEIHALPGKVEEALYEPMDTFMYQGDKINSFTLIGATTKEGFLSKPLRSRFTIAETLSLYTVEELNEIIKHSATILKLSIDDKAVEVISQRSRGTPRVANNLLRRVSYYSRIITPSIAQNALDSIGVSEQGLEALDREILKGIAKSSGPIGIGSLATLLGEDLTTIEGREPYLVNIGLIERTGRGRLLTVEGLAYLKGYETKI